MKTWQKLAILGVILLASGIFLYGGYAIEMSWRDKVAKFEAQVAIMEEQSKELNKELESERSKKQKVRVEYYNTVKTQIKEVEKVINADCKVDPRANELHNKAAKNPEAK
jgi:hypothetical protein